MFSLPLQGLRRPLRLGGWSRLFSGNTSKGRPQYSLAGDVVHPAREAAHSDLAYPSQKLRPPAGIRVWARDGRCPLAIRDLSKYLHQAQFTVTVIWCHAIWNAPSFTPTQNVYVPAVIGAKLTIARLFTVWLVMLAPACGQEMVELVTYNTVRTKSPVQCSTWSMSPFCRSHPPPRKPGRDAHPP